MTYKVICKSCKADRKIGIVNNDGREIIDWLDNRPDPQDVSIVSGRKRLDNEWGWECVCGNKDILTDQENRMITNKQSPDPQEIAKVVRNLSVQKPKFIMESI